MDHQTVNIEMEKKPAFELIPAIVRKDRKKTQCLLNPSYEAVIIEFTTSSMKLLTCMFVFLRSSVIMKWAIPSQALVL